MRGIPVTVTRLEVLVSSLVGTERRYESVTSKRPDKIHNENIWDTEIEGAIAELVFAKATNRYWNMGVNTFKSGDVGRIQVRHTRHANGRLILREPDPVDANYVLVVGTVPNYEVIGFISGAAAKQCRFLDNPNNKGEAYWVPQSELEPLDW